MTGDCASEMSDCSSLEMDTDTRRKEGRNVLTIRLDRRARRLESNNRERRRMHELNAAFQVMLLSFIEKPDKSPLNLNIF